MFSIGIMLLLAFAFFVVLPGVGIAAFLVIKSRRRPPPSLVNPMVRKALNDDLDRATTKAELDRVKSQWLEADGWEFAE